MKTTPILRLLLRHWLPIVVGTVVVAAGFFGYSRLLTPTYTATSAQYFGITTSDSGSALTQGANYVQDQMTSFNQLATSPLVLNPVIDVLGLNISVKELSRAVTVTTPRDSVIMQISVTDPSPARAAAIANAIGSQLHDAVAAVGPKLASGRAVVTVQFIQTALPPTVRSAPNTKQNTMIGLLAGLLLSCGLVIAASRLADRVSEPGALAEVTDAPLLGAIRKSTYLSTKDLVVVDDATSRAAEDLRRLRASVEKMADGRASFLLAITSSIRSEGRSTLAANLAAALAEAGRRVLLLEADFRNPLSELAVGGGDPVASHGLASVIGDPHLLDQVLRRVDEGGFDLIAAGRTEASPTELLSSAAMGRLLAGLRRRYEFVILDTPAVLDFVDVTALGGHLDGVLLLADGPRVRREQIRNTQHLVDLAGLTTLGVVMNQIPEGRRSSGFLPAPGSRRADRVNGSGKYRVRPWDASHQPPPESLVRSGPGTQVLGPDSSA